MKRSPSAAAFIDRGFRERYWFDHDVTALPKSYPDTFLLLERRGFPRELLRKSTPCQLNLYSDEQDGLPQAVFFDRAINWHQQHFGKTGLIAAAGLLQRPGQLIVTVLQSDLCQQIFRSSQYKSIAKTRIETRFKSWPRILLNAILDMAISRGVAEVYIPIASEVVNRTKKQITPDLFQRIYDSPIDRYIHGRCMLYDTEYWVISPKDNIERIVRLDDLPIEAAVPRQKEICLFHDIEENVDTDIDPARCRAALEEMLRIESRHGMRVTYNILGTLFKSKVESIAAGGHALGFHSFDHDPQGAGQLERSRMIDLQVRGYRPARSELTPELSEFNLAYYNFEWLLCWEKPLGVSEPRLQEGIVKIPAHIDDYSLQIGHFDYPSWLESLRGFISCNSFIAVGLHDCYAEHWLANYDELLTELARAGSLVTADQVADRVYLDSELSL